MKRPARDLDVDARPWDRPDPRVCAAVESFAPATRRTGKKVVDLRPATLTVKADRLRGLVRRAEQGWVELKADEVEAFVKTISRLLVEWRDERRAVPLDDGAERTLAALLDHGEVVRTLLRSA